MPLPSLADLRVTPPVQIRMLNSLSDWGAASDALDRRAEHAADNGFLRRHTSPFSLFLVESDDDFRRILMALNGNRHDPRDKLDLVGFAPAELGNAGWTGVPTPGNTRCGLANARHFDWTATRDQLVALCRAVILTGREAVRISKKTMADVVTAATAESCQAAPGIIPPCRVVGCSLA